jgi:hypothetical protein
MPLLKPAVFIGRVSSVNGTADQPASCRDCLPPETAHYLEVLDGPLAGQTFDIGSDLKLASVAAVAGARVSPFVRTGRSPHCSLPPPSSQRQHA